MRAGRSVWFVIVVLAALARSRRPPSRDTAKYILPPGNYGGLPPRRTRSTSCRSTTRSPRCAATSPTPTSTATTSPRTSSRSARRTRRPPAGPGLRSSTTRTACPTSTARPAPTWPSAPAGSPRATAACCSSSAAARRGWPSPTSRHQRVLARHERRSRSCRAPQAEALVTDQRKLLVQDLRRQGPADHRRRPGRGRRHQRLLQVARQSNQPPATVNDVIAVTAFIGSIFGAGGGARGAERGVPREAAEPARAGARAARRGTTRCSSTTPRRRPRSSSASTTARSPAARSPARSTIDEGSIVSLDPRCAPAADAAGPRRAAPCATTRDGATYPAAGRSRQAGVELPRRGPEPLGHGQHARRDGPAARLLLPGDRRADAPQRPGHRGAGRRRARAWRCTS